MELINYITQIIVSVGIFIVLCFIGQQLKKIYLNHSRKMMDPQEFFPKEEIMSLKQVYYLILILFIYICIINFFIDRQWIDTELFLVNSLIDIFISLYIIITYYDGSTRSRIISIFIMPLASISSIVFGGSLLVYWNLIRIPALLYLAVQFYHKFLDFTHENRLGKLILILVSIIFTCLVVTIFLENQNPINSLAMVSNAFTSNGYAVLGDSTGGVLTATFLVWSGYVISGVATATLAAEIVHRNSKKRFEKLEEKIDNLEMIIIQNQNQNTKKEDE